VGADASEGAVPLSLCTCKYSEKGKTTFKLPKAEECEICFPYMNLHEVETLSQYMVCACTYT
jgi:hypothetical protein